jgi:hypothetical protein
MAGVGFRTSGSGNSYSLADVRLSGGAPNDEVAVYFSPEGQLVSVPFIDGTFKIVTSVDEAPQSPDVDFVQRQLDARGPQTERAVVRDVVWGSRSSTRGEASGHADQHADATSAAGPPVTDSAQCHPARTQPAREPSVRKAAVGACLPMNQVRLVVTIHLVR